MALSCVCLVLIRSVSTVLVSVKGCHMWSHRNGCVMSLSCFDQIRQHCASFREGVAHVIKLEWLQMFSSQELQVLISGAAIPIDIADLRRHTNYSGMILIIPFWSITVSLAIFQVLFLCFMNCRNTSLHLVWSGRLCAFSADFFVWGALLWCLNQMLWIWKYIKI